MQIIHDALVAHKDQESEPLDVRLPNGSWVDVYDLIEPFLKAWNELGSMANADALDGDDVAKLDPNSYIVGRSDMAHRVLQIMASAEQKAADQ